MNQSTATTGSAIREDSQLLAAYARLGLLGTSHGFLRSLRLIEKLSRCEASVLIEGATGIGKELAARAIHYRGARHDHPFVPINCGALPDNLIESELFGHERGAFTDAKGKQKGLVAQADGGTLFLDEIDALTPRAQVALLRFLEDHEFRPLGASRLQHVNVRVLAASNASLDRLADAGRFRHDLLFRLDIMRLRLPPLAQRPEDIELLARHFLDRHCQRHGSPRMAIAPDARNWMRTYRWPGNIRELENLMHRAFVLADGDEVRLRHLRAEEVGTGEAPPKADIYRGSFQEAKARVVERFEKHYLRWLMRETHGNITRAARQSGKERRALGKLLKKHGIEASSFLP